MSGRGPHRRSSGIVGAVRLLVWAAAGNGPAASA